MGGVGQAWRQGVPHHTAHQETCVPVRSLQPLAQTAPRELIEHRNSLGRALARAGQACGWTWARVSEAPLP